MAIIYEFNSPPIKGQSFTYYLSLVSQADTNIFQTSVTLAAGDVTVSKDGASFNNIASLPTEIGTSGGLAVSHSAAEMNCNVLVDRFHDAAGSEWQDALVSFYTTITGSYVSELTQADILSDATPFAGANIDTIISSRSDFDNTSDQVIVTTNNDKTGYALSAAGVDGIMDEVYEGTRTFRQWLRLAASVLFGKSAGGGTVTGTFRDGADSKARVTATLDANGNRTNVTLDDS